MLSSQLRRSVVTLAILFLLAASSIYYWSADAARASQARAAESRIKALLTERLATLKDLAAETVKSYQAGGARFTDVHAANEAMFRAELDLAESQKARLAIHEKLVAEAKQHEEHVGHLAKSETGRSLLPLKARVHRLEAEIAFEREKEKGSD